MQHTTHVPLINNLKLLSHLIGAYILFIFNVGTGIFEMRYATLVSSFHPNCSIFHFGSFSISYFLLLSFLAQSVIK